ncbi:MAG: hypothetical protein HF312_17505 [Ignavibacteria bacterium]|jgi:energy-coupling factor transporter transmembrane protein EcfT|nr:hypothetical protein [Ignavibacteria bacterium]MCU7522015.1 hypothetical protein [Ignavibacteria bacterium]
MEANGKIEIENVLKAYVEADDLILVDRSKLFVSHEARLYFEICLAICMSFLGATISKYQLWSFIIAILFGLLTIFFVIRFKKLSKTGKVVELNGVFKYGQNSTSN